MSVAARRHPSTSAHVSPVERTSSSNASGSRPCSHSTMRVATSRFSFAIKFV